MTMPQAPHRCRHCGSGLAGHAASEGLCPACLFSLALPEEADTPPYRIVTVVGRDPGGVTYLADTTAGLPRRVALKILGPRPDAGAILARYHTWRGALEQIHHPVVRRLLDAGLAGSDQVYLASEYVVGTTLADLLLLDGLPQTDRLEIARRVCDAVAAAHQAGMVHAGLDAAHIRVARVPALSVKLFGLGTSVIVDGLSPSTHEDVRALASLARELQIDLGPTEHRTAAEIRTALA